MKKDLNGLDTRILSFLQKGDIKQRITKQVLLLRGRPSVYKRVNKHFPVFRDNGNFHLPQDPNLDVNDLAFNEVSSQLEALADNHAKKSMKIPGASLNSVQTHKMSKYKDLVVSIWGHGLMFGYYEAGTKLPTFEYSLRSKTPDAGCFEIDDLVV